MITPNDYQLSEEQQKAVDSNAHALVVAASAGSGKTEVVARRVERLLLDSPEDPFRILALSYTVKAANELSERLRQRLGGLHQQVDANTTHGFAHSLLRQHGTRIGLPIEPEVLTRDEDKAELLTQWLVNEGTPVPNDLKGVFGSLDLARARLEDAPLLRDWKAALATSGALDYPEMIVKAQELIDLRSARRQLSQLYRHVVVDEAQNLTPAQFELLTTLVGEPGEVSGTAISIMLVGDDKQSIVGFAGADPGLIKKFETQYSAERIELTQNFRSAESIVRVGEKISAELNANPPAPIDTTYAAPGLVEISESHDEQGEGRTIAAWVQGLLDNGLPPDALAPGENTHVHLEEIAILARSASALRCTEEALRDLAIPVAVASAPDDWLATTAAKVAFEVVGLRSSADHQSVQWQLQRLLKVDSTRLTSLEGLIDSLEGHDDPTIAALAPAAASDHPGGFIEELRQLERGEDGEHQLSSWEADVSLITDAWSRFEEQFAISELTWGNFKLFVARQQRGDDLAPGVRLLTIHKSQGREYRAVAVVGLNDGQLPDFRAKTNEEERSELRTFYVAASRPSRLLLLSRASSRVTRYGPRSTEASRFLHFAEPA